MSQFQDFTAIFGYLILIFVALISFLFLFWRAGRHEYVDSDFLFDVFLVCSVGAVIFARIFDIIFHFPVYGWSFSRMIFFNAYGGFDLWGALFGSIVFGYFYLKRKKTSLIEIFDLAAAPIVFAISIFGFASLMSGAIRSGFRFLSFYNFITYFVIFLMLKRLESRKRHKGFFAYFALVSVSVVNLIGTNWQNHLDSGLGFVKDDFQLIKPAAFLIFGAIFWYLFSKRSAKGDFKNIVAWVLLATFKIKRTVSSVSEADKFAKFILMFPYYFAKSIYFLGRVVLRQLLFGMIELMQTLGIKR